MTFHLKQTLENKIRDQRQKRDPPFSATLSMLKKKKAIEELVQSWIWACGMDHYVLVSFIFQIQPVLLMCKHLEEERDFAYCPDE